MTLDDHRKSSSNITDRPEVKKYRCSAVYRTKMVSESFRSIPYGGLSASLSTIHSESRSSSDNMSSHNSTASRLNSHHNSISMNNVQTAGSEQTPGVTGDQLQRFQRRVCGVLMVDERLSRPSTSRQSSSSSSSSTSAGLVLGSLVLERDLSGDELRRAIISTIPSMPRNFGFLTKDG